VTGKRLRVCLAASGGGPVRQLLDLEQVWSRHEHVVLPIYFVRVEGLPVEDASARSWKRLSAVVDAKRGSELPEQSAPQAVYIAMFLNV
jgi:hypothetical protein